MSIVSDDDKPIFGDSGKRSARQRKRRTPGELPPLTQEKLREIAIRYVERYQTTQARLERLLRNKIRMRGWEEGGEEPDIEAISNRMVELGYVDDGLFAESRTRGLARRGFGAQRINQELAAAGIDEGQREEALENYDALGAALAFAKRKRFGPFGTPASEPRIRQRQIASMARAGHSYDLARKIVDAESEEDLPEEEG